MVKTDSPQSKMPPKVTQAHLCAQAIGFNLCEAMAAYEFYMPVAKNIAMFDYVNNNGPGNSFMFVRGSLYRIMILSLARIWDKGASDRDCLESLLNRLGDKEIQKVYTEEKTFDLLKLEDLRERYKEARKSTALKAVVGARNRIFAHSEARFLPYPRSFTALEIGHERELIDLTTPIFQEAASMIRHGIMPPIEYRRSWGEHSTRFWRHIWPDFQRPDSV